MATVAPARVATIVFADGSLVQTRAATGKFQLVGLHANESVNIAMPVPAAIGIGVSVTVQSLDGGTVVGASQVPVTSGVAAIGFQAGSQPGLYRVLITGVGAPATLQFWVRNTQNPSANPPVVNPGH